VCAGTVNGTWRSFTNALIPSPVLFLIPAKVPANAAANRTPGTFTLLFCAASWADAEEIEHPELPPPEPSSSTSAVVSAPVASGRKVASASWWKDISGPFSEGSISTTSNFGFSAEVSEAVSEPDPSSV